MAVYGSGDPLRRLPQYSDVRHMGDDKFEVFLEPSDRTILRSVLFGQKEQRFLLDKLQVKRMSFSLNDTFSIFTRSVLQPVLTRAKKGAKPGEAQLSGGQRAGQEAPDVPKSIGPTAPTVICLHDLEGDATHGWVWMKFARAFYRKGFSIVFIDLPGFGKSQVAQQRILEVEEWVGLGSHLVAKLVEDLGLSSAHVAAVGKTAAFLVKALQRSPHRLKQQHILINPDFDSELDDIFHYNPRLIDPGTRLRQQGKTPEELKLEAQTKMFQDLLRGHQAKVWCIFEKVPGEHHLKKELTHAFLKKAQGHNGLYGSFIGISRVDSEDVTTARLDPKMNLRVMVPSRHLKHCMGEFLKGGDPQASPGQGFVPHRLQETLLTKADLMAKDAEEHSEAEETASHHSEEHLEHLDASVPRLSVSASILDDLARRSGAVARGLKPRKLRPKNFGKYELVAVERLCPWARKRGKKASMEPQRPGTSGSMQVADVEDEDPQTLQALDDTRREMSYGNRKFMQDTLDASVLTYREEEQGIFATARLAKASALKDANAAAQREARLASSAPDLSVSALHLSNMSAITRVPPRNFSKVSFARDVEAAEPRRASTRSSGSLGSSAPRPEPPRASSRTSQGSQVSTATQKLVDASRADMYGLGFTREDTRLWTIASAGEAYISGRSEDDRFVVQTSSRDGSRPGSNAGSRPGSRASSLGQGADKALSRSSSRGLLGDSHPAPYKIRISAPAS